MSPAPGSEAVVSTIALAAATVACYRFVVSPAVLALSSWATVGSRPPAAARQALLGGAAAVLVLAPLGATLRGAAPDAGPLRWVALLVVAIVTWRCATIDYDMRWPQAPQDRDRLLLIGLAFAAAAWAPLLLLWLTVACGRLMAWQHHAMMPLRVLKGYLAWFLVAAGVAAMVPVTPPAWTRAALLLVLGSVSLSHYVKPAWSKVRLGPRWWSWAWENHLHYLIAAAYSWGWARFVPRAVVQRVLRLVRPLDRPLNLATMVVEWAPLVAFLDRRLLVAALAATAVFHVVIVVCSGIFFWESLCTNAALAVVVARLHGAGYAPAFGPWPALFACATFLLCTVDLLWQPFHLGWWDTPFTARILWQVETASGRIQGLYNNYMCPFEREFGRYAGYFLSREPVLHGPLGGVFDLAVRDRIVAAGADPVALSRLKEAYGKVRWDPVMGERHVDYLCAMFTRLNGGARKGPLAGRLRWLKAPGGQLFYWGDLPPYRGEEPVRRIVIRCQDRCYIPGANTFLSLGDRVLREIEVPLPVP